MMRTGHYPRISIVTPSFNHGRYLETCIASVRNQEYPNVEHIIIDGGSTDNSLEVIRKHAGQLSGWVSEPDAGQSDAINKGLRRATGDLFNWINADDWLEPGALFQIARAFQATPDAVAWIGAVRRVNADGTTINVVYPNSLSMENLGQNYNGRQFYQPGCFFRRSLVQKLGGLRTDLHYAMDFDLYLRLLQQGRFAKGDGIWASALIHADAKTQKARGKLFEELIAIQRRYGFEAGARNRFERHFHRKPLVYFPPRNSIEGSRSAVNQPEISPNTPAQHILFVSNYVPRFDIASSNLRIHQILKILCSQGHRLTYLHTIQTSHDAKYIQALPDVHFRHLEMDALHGAEYIQTCKADTVWITNLWSLPYVGFVADLSDRLRAAGQVMFADTMDFHYKKYLRKYEADGNPDDLQTANSFLSLEKRIYRNSDRIITVTAEERDDILKHCLEDPAALAIKDDMPQKCRDNCPSQEYTDRFCPVCQNSFDRFLPFGRKHRENARCPNCNTLERHRLLWLYLHHKTDFFHKPLKVLDVAPMSSLAKRFRALPHIDYLSIDLRSPAAMQHMDITNLQLETDLFDCIFCYHVLEHIPDDYQALRELYRVLKPGGTAILQVPVRTFLRHTQDGAHIDDPQERLRLFGHPDHRRNYGRDYRQRLESIGFAVHADNFAAALPRNDRHRYSVAKSEVLYICRKPVCKDCAAEKSYPVIPNIHTMCDTSPAYKASQHICFVGNFNVNHNLDAIEYFVQDIFPIIAERLPDVEFHVFGKNADVKVAHLASERIKPFGFVQDLDTALSRYRLFVCPMTYGAGMKGKIGSAASAGLPMVSTTIGVEGFPFVDGEHCFIADAPDEFAEKCIHLYCDPITWNNFSHKSRQIMSEQYSIRSVSRALHSLFVTDAAQQSPSGGAEELARQLAAKNWAGKEPMYRPLFDSVEYLRRPAEPNISIVVISWRQHPDTRANFESLAHQRDQNFELIFVANGGQSGEFDTLKPFIDTCVQLNRNTGAYMARNIGAVFARAPIVLFLEDDGIPDAGFVREHLHAHASYDAIAVRGVYCPRTDNPLNAIAEHYYLGPEPFPWYSSLEGNSSYRADIFFRAGGWNDTIDFGHGGRELSIRLSQIEPDLRKQLYCPGPVIYHDYARDKKHYRDKVARQKHTLARLLQQYPRWHDYFRFWEQHKHRTDLVIRKEPAPAAAPGLQDTDTPSAPATSRTKPAAAPLTRIDFLASERHNFSHLLPIWEQLPPDARGTFYIATHLDAEETFTGRDLVDTIAVFDAIDALVRALNSGSRLLVTATFYDKFLQHVQRPMVFVAHGGGQTYQGQPLHLFTRKNYVLDIVPNEHMARVFAERYPATEKRVVGSPKLDPWHTGFTRPKNPAPIVALSFHFDRKTVPETRSAWPHFASVLPQLAAETRWKILGHGHPRMLDTLAPHYERHGIEIVRDFDEVMQRADLYICDHMATLYEFASTGRPVVVLNAPWYRRDVEHGLRYWEHADVGINCDQPGDLLQAIQNALLDPPERQRTRAKAVRAVYAHTDGQAAHRAARAIVECAARLSRPESLLLYPGPSPEDVARFLSGTPVAPHLLEAGRKASQAQLQSQLDRLSRRPDIPPHRSDLQCSFWARALLEMKAGNHAAAAALCRNYRTLCTDGEHMDVLENLIAQHKTSRHTAPAGTCASNADRLHSAAVQAFNAGRHDEAIARFDQILAELDPLHYPTVAALRKIEQQAPSTWRTAREKRFLARCEKTPGTGTYLQAAQFHDSPAVMRFLYERLLHDQKELPLPGTDPLVSIIIPCYNGARELGRTVHSIVRQTWRNSEIIIVDDCSTDESSAVITELQQNLGADITVHLMERNVGVARARNKGASLARGDYLVFLDTGDELLPRFLERLLQTAETHPGSDWFYPVTLQLGSVNRFWSYREFSIADNLARNMQPVTSLIRKSAFEKAGAFPADFPDGYEDWQFWIQAIKAGLHGRLVREILFVYHKSTASRNTRLQAVSQREYETKLKIINSSKECYLPIGESEKELLRSKQRIDASLINHAYIQRLQESRRDSRTPAHGRVVQFYVYKNVHWPMFEALFEYLNDRPEVREIVLCLPDLAQLIGAGDHSLVEKLLGLGATCVARPRTDVDVTFIADTVAGKVAGCGRIVNVGHGTISKGYYFTESVWTERENWVDLLCVPGEYARARFDGVLTTRVAATGMPKLDPVFSGICSREQLCTKRGLDPHKKIVLYAPTFNVDLSSVYDFQDRIQELALQGCCLLIKLHGSTLPRTVARYRHTARHHSDLHFIEDPNIAPYLGGADVMITDVSSAAMEFMALDKPVICYNNPRREKYHGYNPQDIEWAWRDLSATAGSFEEVKVTLQKILTAGDDGKSTIRTRYAAELFADRTGRACENVWHETQALFETTRAPSVPRLSIVTNLSSGNLFAVRTLLYDLQFYSVMPLELVLTISEDDREVAPFVESLRRYSHFRSVVTIECPGWVSPAETRLRGARAATGDYILCVNHRVNLFRNFDYVLHMTFLSNPGVNALTGLINGPLGQTSCRTHLPPDETMTAEQYAYTCLNTYKARQIAPLHLSEVPPLLAFRKSALPKESPTESDPIGAQLVPQTQLCLSLYYTAVPDRDMRTLERFWADRENMPRENRIQCASDILQHYHYPDIAEMLVFDRLAAGTKPAGLLPEVIRSLQMRFYDVPYRKKLIAAFSGSLELVRALEKDLTLIRRLAGFISSTTEKNLHDAPSPAAAEARRKTPIRVLFFFFKNVHIPILLPIYRKLKEMCPDARIAFGYLPHAPQIRAGFMPDELQPLQAFGEPLFADVQTFAPDLTFIADSVYPWVKGCGKLVHVGHGLLSKGQYYTDTPTARREEQADLVCVPGRYHQQIMQKIITKSVDATGMAKLDDLFAGRITAATVRQQFGLPDAYRCILYAPTFNDELSCNPCIGSRITEIIPDGQTLLLIKLHGSTKSEYRQMYRSMVARDQRVIYVDELDITPFLALADVMVSDVSSAMMEFAALDKPVVLFNNPGWQSYEHYNPDDIEFRWRDIGLQATSLEETATAVARSFVDPGEYSPKRTAYTDQLLANKHDGRAAEKIVRAALSLLDRSGLLQGAA